MQTNMTVIYKLYLGGDVKGGTVHYIKIDM